MNQEEMDRVYMRMATVLSDLSKCVSHRVGCLIVRDRRIISNGYNGTPVGYDNCCDVFRQYDPVEDREEHHAFSEMYEIHAEMNALLFASRTGISVEGADLYTTIQPCSQCVKNIVQAGIRRIVFGGEYDLARWDLTQGSLLDHAGIKLVKCPSARDPSVKDK